MQAVNYAFCNESEHFTVRFSPTVVIISLINFTRALVAQSNDQQLQQSLGASLR